MTIKQGGVVADVFNALARIERNELKATFVSAFTIFILMVSYYILRPVRDAMASDWTDTEVSLLWNINFFVSSGLVMIWGVAVSRMKLKAAIPALYIFFAASFVALWLWISMASDRNLADKMFYLWVSVFALFHVTAFWTLMADTFSKDQSKRLFGVIMVGMSAGTLVGPSVPTLLATQVELETLTLAATLGLLLVIPLVFYLYKLKGSELGNEDVQADTSALVLGGKWWKGFGEFVRNPYLLMIGAFILLYVFIGSFFYFEQKNLLADFTRAERTQILGGVDWIVALMTYGLAFFLTGRIVTGIGMPFALAIVPILMAVCLIILAFAPLLTIFLGMQILRRGANYGLTRPCREMLYTHVSREERFKSKPVVDIVVYRGGDAVSGTLFATLTDGLGLGLAAVAGVGAAIAAVWAAVGAWLGKVFDRKTAEE